MTTGIDITGEAVRRQASHVRAHGEDYEAAVERLRARSGGWGDDGLFAEFEAVWHECRLTMLATVPALSGTIGGVGDGLALVSGNVGAADQAVTMPEITSWA